MAYERVGKLHWIGDASHLVLLSFRQLETKAAEPMISFLSLGYTIAVEWAPPYGPIQVWTKTTKDAVGAREHYAFPFVKYDPLAWSQLAVEDTGLSALALEGNYSRIFAVLDRWRFNVESRGQDDL